MKSIIIFFLGKSINLLSFISPSLGVRLSEKVFCKPMRKKFSANQQHFIDQAEKGQFQNLKEKQQFYQWKDKGDKILLLHGWESSAGRWFPLASVLKKEHYHITALDAPAHGLSEGNYFTALKYAASLDKIVELVQPKYIVGHSVGAYALIMYLSRYESAKSIEKIVLLAPTNDMMDVMNAFAKVLGMSSRSLKQLVDYFEEKYQLSFESIVSSTMVQKITQPCLLIHDREDDVLPYSGSEAIAKNLKNGTFVTTDGLGHKLISSDIYKKIATFLRD